MKKKIYFAGGWFTPEQEERHARLYSIIKEDFDVFNPKIEGEITQSTSNDKMNNILLGNIKGIKNSDIVVVIYDGKDTGTIWEAGFAYANKKPIVYYSETLGNKPFNLMLAKTGYFVKNEYELLHLLNKNLTYKEVYSDFIGEIE